MSELSRLLQQAMEDKQACRNGEAFNEIVRRFQDMVFGYVYARTRDLHLAQDVTQEVFLLAYHNLENLRQYDAFPGWIKQIAARESLRASREWKRLPLPLEIPEELPDGNNPHYAYDREDSRGEIQQAIRKLPETQRIPVVLYYIDGYSQQEVASFLNLKLNTVKKRLQRGREKLREEIMNMVKDNFAHFRPSRDDRLVNKISLYTTFDMVAQQGQLTILEQMLVDGIDVNEQDAAGRTLLHWAVEKGHIDAVRLLLKNGADSRIKDHKGKDPLALARKSRNGAIISLLTKNGPA